MSRHQRRALPSPSLPSPSRPTPSLPISALPSPALPSPALPRRTLLRAAPALGWTARPATAAEIAGHASGGVAGLASAPTLPGGLVPYAVTFVNWSGEVRLDPVWRVDASTAAQVADLANWAAATGWRLRAVGFGHTWSPLLADPTRSDLSRVLLVDIRAGLGTVRVDTTTRRVTAGAGATLDAIHNALDGAGLALAHAPAVGAITIGGALAIGAHGSGIPAKGESIRAGWTFGSLSNAVASLEAVVWDPAAGRYAVTTFPRSDPRTPALLCHLGRAFVTAVTLQAGTATRLRCQSSTTAYTMDGLCAPPGTWSLLGGPTVSSLLDRCGRLEIQLFPFTSTPWVKLWSLAPTRPLLSRPVNEPYNYGFADNPPTSVLDLLGSPSQTPLLGQLMLTATTTGLSLGGLADLWGDPGDVQRYVRPTTLKVAEGAWAVICRRADVQRVLAEFWKAHKTRIARYAASARYPINNVIEIRVTGTDRPEQAPAGGAPPLLSVTAPLAGRADLDTVVWISLVTTPGQPASADFFTEMEAWMFANYAAYAVTRVEWSKGWAYTTTGAWRDPVTLGSRIPASFGPGFAAARDILAALDPRGIYSSPLLDALGV